MKIGGMADEKRAEMLREMPLGGAEFVLLSFRLSSLEVH